MNQIQKGIKTNEKYKEYEDYTKKIEGVSRTTNWFEQKTRQDGAKRLKE